ncbi:hypothetical protein ARMGADRAFT_1047443 [Armillaria gallica]|uniref:Uncharacterized protein n=1 Tax=Armillaria gallica TaxID=47427 RepID=A0A2H3DGG4_ARMGA|nr:hypothetical protein ARMGADRAFT_1047443 [Armillaria gallica]
MIDDPKTPGVLVKAPEHPLRYLRLPYTPASNSQPSTTTDSPFSHSTEFDDYETGLILKGNSNYHLFKLGIKPLSEDEANANGSKWISTMKNTPGLLDRCWNRLAMAMVDRIQVWTRTKNGVEKFHSIGKKLPDGIGLEFLYNTDDRPQSKKFLSMQMMAQTCYRKSDSRQSSAPNAGVFGGIVVGKSGAFGSGSVTSKRAERTML